MSSPLAGLSTKEEDEQGPTATPMYIDPQQPSFGQVGSLHSEPVGASVQQLLGLAEKITPTHGPLAQSAPSPKPNQNGSAVPNYSVSLVTKFRITNYKQIVNQN